jgi:hypothetical protein
LCVDFTRSCWRLLLYRKIARQIHERCRMLCLFSWSSLNIGVCKDSKNIHLSITNDVSRCPELEVHQQSNGDLLLSSTLVLYYAWHIIYHANADLLYVYLKRQTPQHRLPTSSNPCLISREEYIARDSLTVHSRDQPQEYTYTHPPSPSSVCLMMDSRYISLSPAEQRYFSRQHV